MHRNRLVAVFGAATFTSLTAAPAFAVPPGQHNGKTPSVENKMSEPAGSSADAKGGAGRSISVPLKAQNGSGESGTATLRQAGSNVVVTLRLTGGGTAPQPAHIHDGTCSKLNPAPKYPLKPVTGGTSVTTVKGITLGDLASASTAINVHASAANATKYVACGNIKRAAMSGMK